MAHDNVAQIDMCQFGLQKLGYKNMAQSHNLVSNKPFNKKNVSVNSEPGEIQYVRSFVHHNLYEKNFYVKIYTVRAF